MSNEVSAPDEAANGSVVKTGELVARNVRKRIAKGQLQPGDKLPPEDELMASLGLARTTVREGLRILESQGLIKVRRGRHGGGRVTHPSIEHLAPALAVTLQLQQVTYLDLHEASRLIEPGLAGSLALRYTDEDLAALTEVVDRAAAAARATDREAFARAAADLHEAVMNRAGNKTLATISRLLHGLITEYYLFASEQASGKATFDRAVRSYRKFVRLVAAGDAAAAEDHWRKQLAFTSGSLIAHDRPISFL